MRVESTSWIGNVGHTRFFRDIQALEASAAVSYILDSRHRFIYCNPACDCFARSNGAPQLAGEALIGFDLFDAIPEALCAVYSEAFQQVLTGRSVWEKSYECSRPTLFRKCRMRIHFLKSRSSFLITNPLVIESPHINSVKAALNTYFGTNGLMMMCVHCRCSKQVGNPDQWDLYRNTWILRGKHL